MNSDVHTLTGAYAADALPADQQRMFERHLAQCDACTKEVAELRATAARLGSATEEMPPADLKALVMAKIDQTRQERPLLKPADAAEPLRAIPSLATGTHVARNQGHDRLRRAAMPVAAALLLIVGALGGVIVSLTSQIDELQANSEGIAEVLAAPDARLVDTDDPGAMYASAVVSEQRGQAVFFTRGLQPTPEGHTHQLWLINADGPVSAGLFDVDEDGHTTQVLTGEMEQVMAIAVTLEPAGGSPQPTTDPIIVLELFA